MWRSKKFIIITVLAAVVLVGGISGVVLAQTENGDDSQPPAQHAALLDKVCEIYEENTGTAINAEELQKAFAQAQSEMMGEALENHLQNLVEQGQITQEEADQYKAWWQARPDMEQFRQQLEEWQQAKPDIPPELNEWQEARPNIPLPGPFERFGGQGFPGGMKWGGGRYFWGR